jgi:hypothetical protein
LIEEDRENPEELNNSGCTFGIDLSFFQNFERRLKEKLIY